MHAPNLSMPKGLGKTLALSTALFALPALSATASAQSTDIVPDSWIFVMQADVDATNLEAVVTKNMSKSKGKSKGTLKHVYKHGLKGFAAEMSAADAMKLADDTEGVAYMVPNSYVEVAGKPSSKGKPPSGGDQVTPYGVTRVGGGEYKGHALAWVIDTGVDSKHPDLRVHKGKSTSIIDGSKGLSDGRGHGTHVAGIIGARDNDIGVVGVAPGVTIASVKVLDDTGHGTVDTIIAGIDYAASRARRGDVINLSISGPYNKALNDAILSASLTATVVVAAGNNRNDAANYSPASANGANIYTVSAIDSEDNFSLSSNYGNPPIDCAAPGVDVLSTLPAGQYGTYTGTSMAAPHVAGLVLKGNVGADGSAYYDPDSNPDPICVF